VINITFAVHSAADPGGLRILVNSKGNIRSSKAKKKFLNQNSSIRRKNSKPRLLQDTEAPAGKTQKGIGPMLPTELIIIDEGEKKLICDARCISNAGGLAVLAKNYTIAYFERTLKKNKKRSAIFARVIVNETECRETPEPNADGTPATLVKKIVLSLIFLNRMQMLMVAIKLHIFIKSSLFILTLPLQRLSIPKGKKWNLKITLEKKKSNSQSCLVQV
jgi:hypothetical protein